MRIAIVGPGALGLLFYSLLRVGGNEVYLIDKNKRRARLLSESGINFISLTGERIQLTDVNITTDPEKIPPPELIILAVKSYDIQAAVRRIVSIVGRNCYLLSIQNGLGNAEIIAKYILPHRIILGVTNQGATRINISTVRHAGKGETILGSYIAENFSKIHKFLIKIKNAFDNSGIDTVIYKDIESVIWSKLIINVGINALTAITNYRNGKLVEIPVIREIMHNLVNEALQVAELKGIKLIYDDPWQKVEQVCTLTKNNISSMLQDILKNHKTEIDAINGAVIAEGKKLGLNLPYNLCVYKIVKGLEKGMKFRVFEL